MLNLVEYVTSFERKDIEEDKIKIGKSNIFYPRDFYKATKEMAEVNNETRGFMLAQPFLENYVVEFISTLGYGDGISVYPEKDKFEAAKQLLLENKDKRAIDFHVHTRGTGKSFFNCFSSGDYNSLNKAIERYKGYKHILFTPTNILTFGLNKPRFILKDIKNSLDKQKEWNEKYTFILNNI